jgi:excisionase family DNA binding protein
VHSTTVTPAMTLDDLAALPARVEQLQRQLAELQGVVARLTGAQQGPLLDTEAAAELLALTPAALRQAVARGTIPAERIGRRLRFRRADLMSLGR